LVLLKKSNTQISTLYNKYYNFTPGIIFNPELRFLKEKSTFTAIVGPLGSQKVHTSPLSQVQALEQRNGDTYSGSE